MNTPTLWQHRGLASFALRPIAAAYRLGNWLDRTFTSSQPAPLPVISIGNATVGGTGKTPVTIALVPILRSIGAVPHILTRGYKGKRSIRAHRVQPHDDWQEVGDEPLLLARAAPTWVGAERLASAHAAAAAGATLAIADDAHQHYRLHKTISFLVIDGPYGIGNGQLLPAGPLREPFATALSRADAIILIGEDVHQLTSHVQIPVFQAALVPSIDPAFLAAQPWLAFAGIGRPEKFFTTLRGIGATLAATRAFPDHHAYSDPDASALLAEAARLNARLITTEKDAVKLPPALRKIAQILPVKLEFTEKTEFIAFLQAKLNLLAP